MSLSFEPEALKILAELIKTTGLSEIELAEGDRKLRLARVIAPVNVPVAAAAPAASSEPAAAPPAPKTDPGKHPGVVKSPMVGVAYLSSEPAAAPYVSVGQTVEAGATLLLIEAMKTFNQIKAPKSGTIRQVLVATGAPVEYDEPLMIIE
jgi:acetyl-CoA carboxylase biotin carboxyl carrier protein